jgi:CDP-diacylglycerol---glycerol-3-phosphate 3-phosphatidyltransferase
MAKWSRTVCLKFVQVITLTRIGGAAFFVSIALTGDYRPVAIAVYIYTLASDILDGWVARKLKVASEFGGAFDGVADKYIGVASTLFLAAVGLPLVACCIILLRDVVIQGFRMVAVGGEILFPPSRLLGALSGLPVRALTLLILFNQGVLEGNRVLFVLGIWIVAASSFLSLAYSIYRERKNIARLLEIDT